MLRYLFGKLKKYLSMSNITVPIAQSVERRIVIPDVTGSSPVGHPNSYPLFGPILKFDFFLRLSNFL